MPLSSLQSAILRLLAEHRDLESYVAGSTYLTRSGFRFSDDIDIFHDREERVARAADEDSASLEKAGLRVSWQRREPTFLPLGAVIWAAVEKAPGFTPEGLINEIRRNAQYTAADFRRVASNPPVDAALTIQRLRQFLDEADAFVARMPTDKIGLLFLKEGKVVQPDPDHPADYVPHAGQRQGHWPSSPEISSAMLERYDKPPSP